MSDCRLSVKSTVTSGPAAVCEIIAGANNSFKLYELNLTISSAVASEFGFGIPAAKGITPTSPISVLETIVPDTSSSITTMATAWGTAPTAPNQFFGHVFLGAFSGAGRCYQFANGVLVPKNSSLVIWAFGTVSVAAIEIAIDE